MESHYPEIFIEYERLDVDCVLFSTTGEHSLRIVAPPPAFARGGAGSRSAHQVSSDPRSDGRNLF
jgi:hypothetical protein